MKVELTKFRVKPGKSDVVDEWINYIHESMDGVMKNLEGDKIYVETIFREAFNDVEYLYWYSMQDKIAAESEPISPIDEKHLEYFDECIDKTFRPEDMTAAAVMIQDKFKTYMKN
ncbi:DUF6176 family protein [Phocicoccus pinnipedialis]|uniref:Uncharacterized protein n=1 Tax=Phocicoccus pinnipedialis TaxID=110845 RepID=A0A6V7RLH9_9BACL|nr:DUF6176 family protein [Jeotgalicoccus pinnipedialis]MBP1939621.1 hypothetical protein [Jeotgalicoccus pinnipedialis]CAD2078959.1 hypothetical protein JEOPIN946_01499 [Jeotgalicoccus pinnipedialis]